MYIQENIPKSEAEKYMALLMELKPECKIHIVEDDVNLYRLGFVAEIPCTMKIGLSEEEAEQLYEQVMNMEADAHCGEEILNKPYHPLNEEEKRIRKAVSESIKKYEQYACLETFLHDCLYGVDE